MNTVVGLSGVTRFVQPDVVVSHFHLRDGDKVADFGAGTGYFIKALSKLVGNDGRVYACDIQKSFVDKIGTLKQESKLSNVEPIWCDLEKKGGTKLADGILDAGILVNTLFQIEEKEQAMKEMARVIQKGGNLFIIDWTESFGGLGPQLGHIVDEATSRSLAENAGFIFERTYAAGGHHYGLSFRKV